MKKLLERLQNTSFLSHNFSHRWEKGRLRDTDRQEKRFACVWKRIVSDRARKVPLLHLKFRDARTVIGQKTNRITSNDNNGNYYSAHNSLLSIHVPVLIYAFPVTCAAASSICDCVTASHVEIAQCDTAAQSRPPVGNTQLMVTLLHRIG